MNACKNLLFFCDFPNSLQPIAYSLSILWDATVVIYKLIFNGAINNSRPGLTFINEAHIF